MSSRRLWKVHGLRSSSLIKQIKAFSRVGILVRGSYAENNRSGLSACGRLC